ncbi:MAG: hypothetical protein QM680_10010 [Luteolibacter sp.]
MKIFLRRQQIEAKKGRNVTMLIWLGNSFSISGQARGEGGNRPY